MDKFEQIFFAVALAVFGWLLFTGHSKASSASSAATTYNDSIVPWYLTYNQAAGFTGPLTTSMMTSSGITAPNTVSSGSCDSCNSGWIMNT